MSQKTTPRSYRPHTLHDLEWRDGVAQSGNLVTQFAPVSWNDTASYEDSAPGRDYRYKIRNGLNASTSLSASRTTVESTSWNLYRKVKRNTPSSSSYNKQEWQVFGDIFRIAPFTGTSSLSETAALNQALARFYQNLNAIDTKFKGLVFAGELRESLTMIRHPASSLRNGVSRYLTSVRSRYSRIRRNARSMQDAVGGTWLEFAFGWTPLIKDIDDGITALYTSDVVKPLFEMARGFGMVEEGSIFDSHVSSILPNTTLRGETWEERRKIVKLYGIHRSFGNGVDNLHHYGFRPSEFVPTIWELIPYSFLVDYFTNIGKILESWSYRFIQPSFLTKTVVDEKERYLRNFTWSRANIAGWTEETSTFQPGTYRVCNRVVGRTPSIPLSTPSLELKVPGRWFQWANLGALALQSRHTSSALNSVIDARAGHVVPTT